MGFAFLSRVFDRIDYIDCRIAVTDLFLVMAEIEADGIENLVVPVLFDLKKEVVMTHFPHKTGVRNPLGEEDRSWVFRPERSELMKNTKEFRGYFRQFYFGIDLDLRDEIVVVDLLFGKEVESSAELGDVNDIDRESGRGLIDRKSVV